MYIQPVMILCLLIIYLTSYRSPYLIAGSRQQKPKEPAINSLTAEQWLLFRLTFQGLRES